MPFLCPACTTATLEPAHLDALECDHCTTCHGHWLTSARYFSWLSAQPATTPLDPTADPIPAAPAPLQRCPACAKFMRPYPIALDLPDSLHKCNTCGGIFLPASLWPTLTARQLHTHLHTITSDIWQSRLADLRRAHAQRTTLLRLLGPADFATLDAFTSWLRSHPHAPQLLAHLQNTLRTSPPHSPSRAA